MSMMMPPDPQMIPPAVGGGGPPQDPAELVSQALDLVRQATAAERDQADRLLLEKISTQLQQYLATAQNDVDSALGSGALARIMRKAAPGQ